MRAWLPERQLYGPEPAGERDTDGLNRVFADAFTDRYRRDGLVGVRVPHLNPQVWRYALLDAGPGAMLWRDEAGHVVAFNLAHRSGGEGWMGPLAVRPDRQGAGVGKTIVRTMVFPTPAPWRSGRTARGPIHPSPPERWARLKATTCPASSRHSIAPGPASSRA